MAPLTFRKATFDDVCILFDWRNDPVARKASHNSDELVFDSHASWLKETLANSKRQLFIFEKEGHPVGTVRIDYEENKSAELSWTVAPEARGKGIAKQMVRMIVNQIPDEYLVRAEVNQANEASVKVAEAAGLRAVKQVAGVLYYQH